MKTVAVAGAVVALMGVSTVAGAAPGTGPAIPLNTEQETTGSNTGASGFFSYTIDGSQLCYTLTARNLSVPAGAAHIHVGDRNEAGGIVIPLVVGSGTTWTHSACPVLTDPAHLAALEAIEANPRDYYVNVHTPTFPGGEIRGQLK
ncbi:CHRD domain-containing protein [Pseudarthrobacter sp. J75]|nr:MULTISPECIES: CHRD domain-containing protein [unclassified Pseudarthrobacter]MEE2527641.1 CHRD domain-containing protein [Pseudarthrobacter sp. J75]MEE2570883.1 CHRD domain-containing protein [Pseudarthrobacter sp. J64]